jgi:Raf kinase inhibitor-like YbhB/YbcL family protein
VAILGKLLMNRRAGDTGLAWNEGTLAGPETLRVTSPAFAEGGAIPREHVERRIGGQNVSPALAWTGQPAETAQLLLFLEDTDAPTGKPFVHCVALLTPDFAGTLPTGALDGDKPAAGVTLLRSPGGSGYRGPAPIKGHGPHHYVFQIYALGTPLPETVDGTPITRLPARRIPTLVPSGSLLARGRLIGVYER